MEDLKSLDDILDYSDKGKKFHVRLIVFLAILSALCPITWWLQVFMDMVPEDYFCDIPEFGNYTFEDRKRFLIPHYKSRGSKVRYSHCHMYDVNWDDLPDFPVPENFPKTLCKFGTYFNLTGFYQSTITEFQWVCGDKWRSGLPQTMFYIGAILGVCICGYISDTFGRLHSIVGCCLLQALAMVAIAFTHSYSVHLLFRLLWGICTPYCSIVFILAFEYVRSEKRTSLNVLGAVLGYIPAAAILPYVTLYINDWRNFNLILSLPFFTVVFLPYFIPESPRWELQMGKKSSVLKTVEKIASLNSIRLNSKQLANVQNCLDNIVSSRAKNRKHKFWELFHHRTLKMRMIFLCISWFMLSICYDGNVRNVSNLKSDPLFSWFIYYILEYPGFLLTHFATDSIGRRWTVGGSILAAGLFVAMCGLFTPGSSYFLLCAVLSRLLATVAINVMFQFRTELIPTSIRSQGNSFVEIMGLLGSLITPYLIYTTDIWYDLPFVFLTLFSVLSALATFRLPETLNKDLPDDLSDFSDAQNLI